MSLEEQHIRAWKDAEHRASLDEQERNRLLPNPAGEIELTDDELNKIQGGIDHIPPLTTITTIGKDGSAAE